MPSEQREKRIQGSKQEAEPVKQRSQRDEGLFDNVFSEFAHQNSFDNISIYLVTIILLGVLAFQLLNTFYLGIQWNAFNVFLALMTGVFTLLSVRESKRDREASVAPTLFVGKTAEGKYGILNLGSGPANELLVKVSTDKPDDWDDVDPEVKNEILRVDDFRQLKYDSKPKWVKLEYRSNVGKKYDYVREVV